MNKAEFHIFQGMRRDNHQIKQDSKFLWDAHNIRLTNRDDNTLLSITNEKGTSHPLCTLDGQYVGHCVLDKYLVIFTATIDNKDTSTSNWIYRINKNNTGYIQKVLYQDSTGALNLSPNNPIEAIGLYEQESIQKVYWVDGKNQPRVINIVEEDKEYNGTSFDFVRTLRLKEDVTVTKEYGNGSFPSGVIQYAFSYFNKYGQESNLFYITPLYYISPSNRGESPENKVACQFNINIKNTDKFQYIRVYSIQRTSIDATPSVKIIRDLEIENKEKISLIDDGRSGDSIDPFLLLLLNKELLRPYTIEQKNNVLFLGNIKTNTSSYQSYKDIIEKALNDNSITNEDDKILLSSKHFLKYIKPLESNVYYEYSPELSKNSQAGFKYLETYRCGIQVQDKYGIWSSPIYIKDMIIADKFPWDDSGAFTFYTSGMTIGKNVVQKLIDEGAVKVRTCIVFPDINDRSILCQGVLCPTVYNVKQRNSTGPFAASSWFFRPAGEQYPKVNYRYSYIQFRHNKPLYNNGAYGSEIQNIPPEVSQELKDINLGNLDLNSSQFFVDENIVTFHSPDIEFDTSLQNSLFDNVKLSIIGVVQLGSIYGDIDIKTSSATPQGSGFNHQVKKYRTKEYPKNNGGLIASTTYDGAVIKADNGNYSTGGSYDYLIYPWHRSGSLNNDENRSTGARTAVLSKKVISNLKFFDNNYPLYETGSGARVGYTYTISTPNIHIPDNKSLLKFNVPYYNNQITYLGDIDTLITNKYSYRHYVKSLSGDIVPLAADEGNGGVIPRSTDPVRMKYKSSPHFVFSLLHRENTEQPSSTIPILPRDSTIDTPEEKFQIPDWWENYSMAQVPELPQEVEGMSVLGDLVTYLPSRQFFTSSLEQVGTYRLEQGELRLVNKRADGTIGSKVVEESQYKDKVLRVYNGLCKVYLSEGILPGTSSTDYSPIGNSPEGYHFYTGNTRYYKVIKGDNNKVTLEPIILSNPVMEVVAQPKSSDNTFYSIDCPSFKFNGSGTHPYLLLAQLTKDVPKETRFGGKDYTNNLWIPSSDPVSLISGNSAFTLYQYGDTWYERYDCLKTYPYTQEDENQVVEIGSFMCETRVNIDGRYDKNRGNLSNLTTTPQNFNLLNQVYSQKDNFFNYRVQDLDYYKSNEYQTYLIWSQEKAYGEKVDTWTTINMSSNLSLDGTKGSISSIKAWNEYLLCFQEKAINYILYNTRVQVPTSDRVPIEIANNQKVEGSRFITNSIGCNNKWSIITTPQGIYFSDLQTNSIYFFNGQLHNISKDKGMSWWIRQNMFKQWYPVEHYQNGLRTFYDKKYEDIYFTPGITANQLDSLCYSEQLGQFTSFMSYGGTQAMFNFDVGFYSLKSNNNTTYLYENNVGDYNYFYGEIKGWDFSFVSNDNPNNTKIFDTFEIKSDTYNSSNVLQNIAPITFVKASNEWQSAEDNTDKLDKTTGNLNLKNKFRIWRGLIPRPLRNSEMGLRISNPWALITLGFNPKKQKQVINKTIIHDVTVKYTI